MNLTIIEFFKSHSIKQSFGVPFNYKFWKTFLQPKSNSLLQGRASYVWGSKPLEQQKTLAQTIPQRQFLQTTLILHLREYILFESAITIQFNITVIRLLNFQLDWSYITETLPFCSLSSWIVMNYKNHGEYSRRNTPKDPCRSFVVCSMTFTFRLYQPPRECISSGVVNLFLNEYLHKVP
jgi:hypothetical protein